MDVKEAIENRRAYRALAPAKEVDQGLVRDLASSAALAASCYNKQPWRFVFCFDEDVLERVFEALPRGNAWARRASMIIAVCSRKDLDCVVGRREYYLFDTGMATCSLILRATELGLVAHPIAGYDEERVIAELGVPDDQTVITLVVVGRHSDVPTPELSEGQTESERTRPDRLPLGEFCFVDSYGAPVRSS